MDLLIGIAGMPACGKSTVAAHWKGRRDVSYIHMSDFIWAELEKKGIEKSNITGSMYGLYSHEVLKDKPIIAWTDKKIKEEMRFPVVLLDSVRSLEHHEHLRKKYGRKYKLVSVLAGPDERFKRTVSRRRFGEKISKSQFLNRDVDELSRGLGELIVLADFYVDANTSKADMIEAADKILKKIKK